MAKKQKAAPSPPPEIKLDLGCGRNKLPGYTGVDLYAPDDPDIIKANLFELPWRKYGEGAPSLSAPLFANDSVTEIHASHFLEHVPQKLRWPFMEECWRVLKPEGIMRLFVPSWKSERAYGDMTHEWPPVVAMFFFYLNKGWREANKLTYGPYDLKCNFDHQAGPTVITGEWATRAQEAQQFACTHYLETYLDMWVTLTKKNL